MLTIQRRKNEGRTAEHPAPPYVGLPNKAQINAAFLTHFLFKTHVSTVKLNNQSLGLQKKRLKITSILLQKVTNVTAKNGT